MWKIFDHFFGRKNLTLCGLEISSGVRPIFCIWSLWLNGSFICSISARLCSKRYVHLKSKGGESLKSLKVLNSPTPTPYVGGPWFSVCRYHFTCTFEKSVKNLIWRPLLICRTMSTGCQFITVSKANHFDVHFFIHFLSDPFWKGFQISMTRVFRTVCTFSPSRNSTFPKNEDFCFFKKQDFSKKRGLLRFRKKVLFQKIRTFTINRYTSESSF